MADINDFIREEESRMTGLQRFFGIRPSVTPTQKLATKAVKIKPPGNEVVIKQSRAPKVIAILFICFFGFTGFRALNSDPRFTASLWVNAAAACLFLGISYVVIYFVILDKRRQYNIVINNGTLTIENIIYQWADIMGTYIMKRKEGKVDKYYLVLNTRTQGFKKYNLSKYNISTGRLSTYIEHFKPMTK